MSKSARKHDAERQPSPLEQVVQTDVTVLDFSSICKDKTIHDNVIDDISKNTDFIKNLNKLKPRIDKNNKGFRNFVASHMWDDRKKLGYPYRGTSAFDFIEDVYKDWLKRFSFSQGVFKGVDDGLWIRIHKEIQAGAERPDWLPTEWDARLESLDDPSEKEALLKARESAAELRRIQRKRQKKAAAPKAP